MPFSDVPRNTHLYTKLDLQGEKISQPKGTIISSVTSNFGLYRQVYVELNF